MIPIFLFLILPTMVFFVLEMTVYKIILEVELEYYINTSWGIRSFINIIFSTIKIMLVSFIPILNLLLMLSILFLPETVSLAKEKFIVEGLKNGTLEKR